MTGTIYIDRSRTENYVVTINLILSIYEFLSPLMKIFLLKGNIVLDFISYILYLSLIESNVFRGTSSTLNKPELTHVKIFYSL